MHGRNRHYKNPGQIKKAITHDSAIAFLGASRFPAVSSRLLYVDFMKDNLVFLQDRRRALPDSVIGKYHLDILKP